MAAKTYADRAKSIMQKYKKRLGDNFDKGDSLALEAMNQELSALQMEQEEERERLGVSDQRMMEVGGNLRDNPYLTGSGGYGFDAWRNTNDPAFTDIGMTSKAGFGDNWDKPYIGLIHKANQIQPLNFLDETGVNPYGSFANNSIKTSGKTNLSTPIGLPKLNLSPVPKATKFASDTKVNPSVASSQYDNSRNSLQNIGYVNQGVSKLKIPQLGKSPIVADKLAPNKIDTSGVNNDQAYKSRVPWMGAAAGVVGNLLMNQQIDLPEYNPVEYNPTKLNANLVDYSRGREQIMSERDQANAMIEGSAKGLGSQNALMENILAGRTGTQRVAGQQFNQSIENEGNINANILNETGKFNAAQNAEAARINMQNDLYSNQINRENLMINTDRRDSKIQGILDSVTGYGKDLLAANQYDTMLGMMTPDNYKAYASKDSKARKFFGISPNMGMKLSKTDRMEKGGSLMLFGDDEYGKLMSRVKKKN